MEIKSDSKSDNDNKNNIDIIEYLPKDIEKLNEIVIVCHGFKSGNLNDIIKKLANKLNKENIGVVTFDFFSYGNFNNENLTVEKCIEDLLNVEKYIKNKYKDILISIFASSFGGYITLNRIIEEPNEFKSVVLRCPTVDMYTTFYEYILKENGYTKKDLEENNYLDIKLDKDIKVNKSFVKDIKAHNVYELYLNQDRRTKMLIMQGKEDKVVPCNDVIAFSELDKENIKLKIIEGAGHGYKDINQSEEILEYAIEYMKNS